MCTIALLPGEFIFFHSLGSNKSLYNNKHILIFPVKWTGNLHFSPSDNLDALKPQIL